MSKHPSTALQWILSRKNKIHSLFFHTQHSISNNSNLLCMYRIIMWISFVIYQKINWSSAKLARVRESERGEVGNCVWIMFRSQLFKSSLSRTHSCCCSCERFFNDDYWEEERERKKWNFSCRYQIQYLTLIFALQQTHPLKEKEKRKGNRNSN